MPATASKRQLVAAYRAGLSFKAGVFCPDRVDPDLIKKIASSKWTLKEVQDRAVHQACEDWMKR